MMKAARIADKDKFEIIEQDIPKPDGGKVLIKVAYTGICGSDLHYWHYGDSWAKGWILGHEFAGIVEDPGSRTDLKKGDRVVSLTAINCEKCKHCLANESEYCTAVSLYDSVGIGGTPGGYCEYVLVNPKFPIKIADNVDIKEAAMVEPTAVGHFAVRKSKVNKDSTVLVIGGGIIGLVTAMWAKKAGVKNLTMVETGDHRLAFAKNLGMADHVIDGRDKDYMEKIMAANDGEMYDVMFECVGVAATLNNYLKAVDVGGKVIVMGVPNEQLPFDFNTMVTRNMQLIASHGWGLQDFVGTVEALGKEEIDLKPFITDIRKVDEVQEIFEDLTSGNTKNVKVLLEY